MSRVLIEAIIAAKQSFANISITKWSCANKFYVLIGSTICQLSVQLLFYESHLNYFFSKTVPAITKLSKVDCLAVIIKR